VAQFAVRSVLHYHDDDILTHAHKMVTN